MNSEPITVDFATEFSELSAAQRIAEIISLAIYAALLTLIVLAAVAYGGSDPWWKAFFTSAIFGVGILSAIEMILSERPRFPWIWVLLPMLALGLFSLVQTISLSSTPIAGSAIQLPFWNAISADPYETRIFALQLLALTLFAAMIFRYAATDRRLRFLIHLIIGVAVLSAIFGLIRQTTQHEPGFGLPLLLPEQGYGQFINKNHFAYLMEMGFGLSLGLVLAGGARRDRSPIYFAVLLPIWTALVLSNSRGGILAMILQLAVTLLLFPYIGAGQQVRRSRLLRLVESPVVRISIIVSMVLLCVVGVLWIGGDRLASNIEAARGEFQQSETRVNVNRTEVWQATIRMIASYPFAGVGMGGYWTVVPQYHDASGTMTPQQAHNDYLELAASGGVVGVALFIWFLIVVLRRARVNLASSSSFRRAACFAGLIAITGVAAHSLVDFGLHRMLNAMIFMTLIVCVTGFPENEVDVIDSSIDDE
ncbi:MAG TPA: O-antigen ligase family protein [Pyrinomonadaceae bacterium]|nr:O-antigen ligase family protein [Pyrinomonadaceae bacterium]